MKLSVIIPVWEKHDLAVAHVRECQNSVRIPDEIIVVNDGGEDDLKEKLQQLEKKTKIIYAKILPPKIPWNYTGARNLGFWLSSGDLISIEDQDHIPEKNFYKLALEELEKNPDSSRCQAKWRHEVNLEDIVSKPVEQWVVQGGRQPHHDCCVITRELYLKMKGYDERFAGEYGWSNTNWRRRLVMNGFTKTVNVGIQFVVNSPKTRGLSYRNFRLAKQNKTPQSPIGILNFLYTYEQLGN